MNDHSRVLVGKSVTIRADGPEPDYFTAVHRLFAGKTGRVHAVVPAEPRENPLVKVGFDDGSKIAFFRLSDLIVDREAESATPVRHGKRGSHLPGGS
jgi:hypothetical protein